MSTQLYTLPLHISHQFIDDSNKDEEQDPEYTGIIGNTNLTSYSTHLSPKVLRSFAKSAREGVTVLSNHERGQVIGRSISGTYSTVNQEVKSKFYIQRGLEFAGTTLWANTYKSTDDYIKAINRGTYTDLSVGFNKAKEVCDVCGLEMQRGFFFTADENGHYPGKKIYINSDNKEVEQGTKGAREIVVTAEVTEGELFEYSVVDMGALPGAEVVKQAKLHKIEPIHKQYMLDRFGFNVDEPEDLDKLVHLLNPFKLLSENKSFSFPDITKQPNTNVTYVTGGTTMDPILKVNEETINALELKTAKLEEQNRDLQAQLAANEDVRKLSVDKDEEIASLQEKNKELEQKLVTQSEINEEYDRLLNFEKQYAKDMWVRLKGSEGVDSALPEFQSIIADNHKLSSIKSLSRQWRIQADINLGVTGESNKTMASNIILTPDPYTYDKNDYYRL